MALHVHFLMCCFPFNTEGDSRGKAGTHQARQERLPVPPRRGGTGSRAGGAAGTTRTWQPQAAGSAARRYGKDGERARRGLAGFVAPRPAPIPVSGGRDARKRKHEQTRTRPPATAADGADLAGCSCCCCCHHGASPTPPARVAPCEC